MTIQLHEPQQPVITHVGAAMIEATAHALVHAHQIGEALCRTAFVPTHFRGKPEDAAAAILFGSTIDMDPVTALQNIFVIGGKPALYARTMVAIVMSKGHKIWTEDESEGSVTVCGQRRGSETVERVTWTTEMAERAGYLTNAKYKTDPRSMLYARASGDVARRIAPDALLGMAHNFEELSISQLDERPALGSVSPTAPAAERMGAILGTTSGAGPDVGASAEPPTVSVHSSPEAEPAPEPDPITSAQVKKIAAAMGEAGITVRTDALKYVNDVLPEGRAVASRNELTKDEASRVIEALEADLAQPFPVAPEAGADA